MNHLKIRWASMLVGSICLFASSAAATQFNFEAPDFDRWNYPFNGSPGFRDKAPTFSAVGAGAFDNFDGQFLIGFDTNAAGIPALNPGEKYQINSVKVTATHSTGAFTYDPTFDPYQSHLDGADPEFVADADAGRPVEIYGASTRNGYVGFAFDGGTTAPPFYNEGSFFAFADPTLPKVRNAFPFDPSVGDVANVVDDRLFAVEPWAVGQVAGLSAGDTVEEGIPGISAGSTFSFDLDLSRPDVLGYLTDGLEAGGLFFSIVSLTTTSQANPANPNFFTSNSFDPAAIPPTLMIDVDVVPIPEPSTMILGVLGGVAFLAVAVRRMRCC